MGAEDTSLFIKEYRVDVLNLASLTSETIYNGSTIVQLDQLEFNGCHDASHTGDGQCAPTFLLKVL
jgi:hypothetical protein